MPAPVPRKSRRDVDEPLRAAENNVQPDIPERSTDQAGSKRALGVDVHHCRLRTTLKPQLLDELEGALDDRPAIL